MSEVDNELENALSKSDFDLARRLIAKGANINAVDKYGDSIIVEPLIFQEDGYTRKSFEKMRELLSFIIDNGFDPGRENGAVGSSLLDMIRFTTFDSKMIELAKILLDVGARPLLGVDDNPLDGIAMEMSYQINVEKDYKLGNILEALYQMFEAAAEGRPYSGINSFLFGIGKTIKKVLTLKTDEKWLYEFDNHKIKCEHCFRTPLFIDCETGYLVIDEYQYIWWNDRIPENVMDVSQDFEAIIGGEVDQIEFNLSKVEITGYEYECERLTIGLKNSTELVLYRNVGGDLKEDEAHMYFNVDREEVMK